MNVAQQKDIGSFINAVVGTVPTTASAGAINGSSIDRQGYQSCALHVSGGAATGTPTSLTIASKIQESSTGSSGWTDVSGAAITTSAAASTDAEADVDLSGVKRYVRVVTTVAFVGGTSPAIPVAASVVLGGAVTLPV